MGNEINNRESLLAKGISVPGLRVNEAATKTQLLANDNCIISGTYANNECPRIDDVTPNVYTTDIVFDTPENYVSFTQYTPGSYTMPVISEMRTYFNGTLIAQEPISWSIYKTPVARFHAVKQGTDIVLSNSNFGSAQVGSTCVLRNAKGTDITITLSYIYV